MALRTFKPDVAKIERLRIQKGWALPDLAAKACVSKRTIDSIMRGKEVVISTISRVAMALGVSPDELIVDFHLQPAAPPKGKRFEVAFRIDVRFQGDEAHDLDFEEFDEASDLLAFLEKLTKLIAPMAGDIEVTGVETSSVIVRVRMTIEDILSVLKLYAEHDPHALSLFQSMQILATREEFFGDAPEQVPESQRPVFLGDNAT